MLYQMLATTNCVARLIIGYRGIPQLCCPCDYYHRQLKGIVSSAIHRPERKGKAQHPHQLPGLLFLPFTLMTGIPKLTHS